MTLQKETRDAIGRTVRRLRDLFEIEFGKQASGRFGIQSSPRVDQPSAAGLDAWLDPIENLSLTPAETAQRDELIHALRYLTGEGNEPGEAVARLIREAAFTAVNRLLAIRVAEAIEVLPPVLARGRQSAGYLDTVGDLFPALAHDEDSYWAYLQVAGDELAPGMPRLFDRGHPTSAFVPSRACIDQALELLTADDLVSTWHEPETLGWGYQFFNGSDVKQMRDASSAPRNSRELAIRNQFFTPRYVVDWLVQNTLGRRLGQAGYELELPLMVGEVGEPGPLALEDVRLLDPAVGSGHFLLGCYDLLEQAWQSTGTSPEEAAPRILPCLFGIDIDPRAAQVAEAVLLLRALRSAPSAELKPPTIVTAAALPHSTALRERAFGKLSPAARHLAEEITETLDQAPDLGSLLKVDQQLDAGLAEQQATPRLALEDTRQTVFDELRNTLGELASASASPEQRMFTADAGDALNLVTVLRKRFDVVLMNPPFGPGVHGKALDTVKSLYPNWWTELYACFLTRSFELLTRRAYVGMVSSSQFLTTRTMREFRTYLATKWPPVAVVDLGPGVMHDASVHAAVTVFSTGRTSAAAHYRDLSKTNPARREAIMRRPLDSLRTIDVRGFLDLDRTPFAFHVPPRVLELWEGSSRLEPDIADVRKGNSTFDTFRFLRLRWEVDRQATQDWVPYQKGGEFQPFVAPSHLVIDWRHEGQAMKEYAKGLVGSTAQVMQSSSYWYRAGITFPYQSNVGFSARVLPEGEIFGSEAVSIFPHNKEDIRTVLGLVNSTPFAEILRVFGRSRKTENGAVKSMPVGRALLAEARNDGLDALVEQICHIRAFWEQRDETSPFFVHPMANGCPDSSQSAAQVFQYDRERLRTAQNRIDRIVGQLFGVSSEEVIDPDVTRRMELATSGLRYERDAAKCWAEDAVSWAIGAEFGRWRSNAGEHVGAVNWDDLLRAIPPSPPAAASEPPDLLIVGGDSADSLGSRAYSRLAGLGEHVEADVRSCLKTPSVAHWIDTKFFRAHLSRYAASRRYAPIYWQLAVPSKRWGLWLYAPSLSRESLFAVARQTSQKLSSVKDQIRSARERAEADQGWRARVETLEDLVAELGLFAAVADEVSQSGWQPDIGDGFVLNAAPLENLFVDKKWRGVIATHRKAMQNGEYPWATVQREYFARRA